MKKTLLLVLLGIFALPALGQLQFLERLETPAQSFEPVFELLRRPSGLVAFRTFQARSLAAPRVLEYYLIDEQLQAQALQQVQLRDGFDLIGYDVDGDHLYLLLAKGTTAAAEKYILKLDLLAQQGLEYPADNLLPMDLVEFLVLDERAIFLGNAELRPALQLLSLEDKSVQTVQGIYGNDTQVMQLIKRPDQSSVDVLLRRRGTLKSKETLLLSFDLEGKLLRELRMDQLGNSKAEMLDGILLSGDGYAPTLIGSFGKEITNSYQGMYKLEINEFDEIATDLYTLEDFPNFYNYLPENQKAKKLEWVTSQLAKGKVPSIRNSYLVRDVKEAEDSYLIYFDQLTVTSSRGSGRVTPPQESSRYRYDRGSRLGYVPYYMDPFYSSLAPGQAYSVITEYNYKSAHLMEVAKTGQVLWENAASYPDVITSYPEPFAEIAVQGEDVFHLYLVNDQIKLNYFRGGEKRVENKTFALILPTEEEKIQYTDVESLRLLHWKGPYFLLSGLQKVRYVDGPRGEAVKEVFFISKILVDGDLYRPEEGKD